VARFGGDEFVVMFSELKDDKRESLMQATRASCGRSIGQTSIKAAAQLAASNPHCCRCNNAVTFGYNMIAYLKTLPISTRLWVLVAVFSLIVVLDNFAEVSSHGKRMREEREQQLVQLVETAHSVLRHYEQGPAQADSAKPRRARKPDRRLDSCVTASMTTSGSTIWARASRAW
jgi:hypothetical protein